MKEFHENEERKQPGDTLPELMIRCGRVVAHKFDGGRGQGSILRLLAEKKEMSQSELLEALSIRPGSLSELIGKLEARGLAERRADPEDKRRVLVSITETGLREAEQQTNPDVSYLFRDLSGEEQESLRLLLKKVWDSWEPYRAERRREAQLPRQEARTEERERHERFHGGREAREGRELFHGEGGGREHRRGHEYVAQGGGERGERCIHDCANCTLTRCVHGTGTPGGHREDR